jgi:hypothetical protein
MKNEYDILVFTESWLKKKISLPSSDYGVIDLFSDTTKKGEGIRIVFKSYFVV